MYDLIFAREAQKQYQKLTPEIARRVNDCLDHLCQDPFRYPQAVALKGNKAGLYRWRVGDWRVVYEVDAVEQIVYIEQILHRSSVY